MGTRGREGSFQSVDVGTDSRSDPWARAQIRLRADALEWREVEGEIVALDIRDDQYLAVNHTGVVLWKELTTGATKERLVTILVERYGVDRERAAADTDAFLSLLHQRDLIET